MNYATASSIYEEIAELVPLYKGAKSNGATEVGAQWPFLKDGRFGFEDGLARLSLPKLNSYETLETLTSLL